MSIKKRLAARPERFDDYLIFRERTINFVNSRNARIAGLD